MSSYVKVTSLSYGKNIYYNNGCYESCRIPGVIQIIVQEGEKEIDG